MNFFDYATINFGFTANDDIKRDFEERIYLFKRNTEQLDYR